MRKREFASPLETETAFYHAFEQGDPDAMRDIWDDGEGIECIHPLGGRLKGKEVHAGWRDLFTKARPIVFHVSDRRSFEQHGLTVHMVLESILFPDGVAEPLRILSTNVYRQGESGWKMVLRHSSPAPFESTASAKKALH